MSEQPSIKCKDGIWGLRDDSNAAAHWFELDGHPYEPLLRSACGRHASNDLFGNDIRHSDHGKCHDCVGRVISGMTTMGWKWDAARNVVDEDRVVRYTPYGVTAAPGVYSNAKGHKIVVEYVERPKPGTAQGKSPWELVADAVGRDSIMPMHAIPVGPLMVYSDEFSTEAEAGEWLKAKLQVGPLLSIANEMEYIMSTEKLINGVEISIEALKEAIETREIEKQASIEEAERLYKQVITFREDAKRKEMEILAINETIEYLQNRSGKPQFVNERLNRMADTNPQAHRSACATNQFSGEVGDVQQDIPASDCNCGPGCGDQG